MDNSSLVRSSLSLLSVEVFLSPSLDLDFFFFGFGSSCVLGDLGPHNFASFFSGEYFFRARVMRDWRIISSSVRELVGGVAGSLVTSVMMLLRVLRISEVMESLRSVLITSVGTTSLVSVSGLLISTADFFFLSSFLRAMTVSHWACASDLSAST